MTENPNAPKPPHILANDTTAPFGFTFGNSHTQSSWSEFRRLNWPQLVEMLTSHVPGQKEGTCIVPAQFKGARRHKDDATRIDVAFLDSDAGMTLAEIESAIIRNGWEAVISSTHSHMSTRTKVALANWDRYFANNPQADAEKFLIDDKGYAPSVAAGAYAAETTGEHVFVEHAPCPKFRVAIPLESPWLSANYQTQRDANAYWKNRIEALASALGLAHDQACTDTSRLFYLPRRPPDGVVPETAVVTGAHCDIFALLDPAAPDLLSHEASTARRQTERFSQTEYLDPITGEIVDLAAWAKEYGTKFLIAKALRTRMPKVLTGHVAENRVHIDCPNVAAHTDPSRDGATYVINGGSSATKGFVVHCRHAHCTDRDRLFFLRGMLDHGWLTADDLSFPAFFAKPEQTCEEPKKPGLFDLTWFDQILPALDCSDFVQGILVSQSGVVVYGESNAGKTFWATDLALHVAGGLEYRGLRVEQGGVIYCVLEGGNAFRNRVDAWRTARSLQGQSIPFAALQSSINLLNPDADTQALIDTIQAAAKHISMPIRLVVIDTLSRSLAGGNENAPEDMGSLVLNMDRIRAETGACVLFIHHSGKDAAKGARGHSLLRAAVDTEIEVVADDAGPNKTATVVKQRDLKKGEVFSFSLDVVVVGQNPREENVTSCVVVHSSQAAGAVSGTSTRLRGHTKRAFEVLTDAIAEAGRSNYPGTPPGACSIPEKWWRDRFYERAMPAENQDTKQRAFRRASTDLLNDRVVGMGTGRVWVAGHVEAPRQTPRQEAGQSDD